MLPSHTSPSPGSRWPQKQGELSATENHRRKTRKTYPHKQHRNKRKTRAVPPQKRTRSLLLRREPLVRLVPAAWIYVSTHQRQQMPFQLLDLRVPSAHLHREPLHRLRQLGLVAASARSLRRSPTKSKPITPPPPPQAKPNTYQNGVRKTAPNFPRYTCKGEEPLCSRRTSKHRSQKKNANIPYVNSRTGRTRTSATPIPRYPPTHLSGLSTHSQLSSAQKEPPHKKNLPTKNNLPTKRTSPQKELPHQKNLPTNCTAR